MNQSENCQACEDSRHRDCKLGNTRACCCGISTGSVANLRAAVIEETTHCEQSGTVLSPEDNANSRICYRCKGLLGIKTPIYDKCTVCDNLCALHHSLYLTRLTGDPNQEIIWRLAEASAAWDPTYPTAKDLALLKLLEGHGS